MDDATAEWIGMSILVKSVSSSVKRTHTAGGDLAAQWLPIRRGDRAARLFARRRWHAGVCGAIRANTLDRSCATAIS
jgi:hypothetical protein